MNRMTYDSLFDKYKPIQNKEELWEFIEVLNIYSPSYILEIGLELGGCAAIWGTLCYQNYGKFIGIDLDLSKSKSNFDEYNWCDYQLIQGDSTSKNTIVLLRQLLKYSDIPYLDLVFIDANHDFNCTKSDIINYMSFLKPNGILAVHDAYQGGDVDLAINHLVATGVIPKGKLIHNEWEKGKEFRGIYYFINRV